MGRGKATKIFMLIQRQKKVSFGLFLGKKLMLVDELGPKVKTNNNNNINKQ